MRPNVLPTLHSLFDYLCYIQWPIPEAVWYKAWLCGHLVAGIVGPNSDRGMDVSYVSVVTYRSLRPEESYQVWCV